jgi:dienelactone hydrolase
MLRFLLVATIAIWTAAASAETVDSLADGRAGEIEFLSVTPTAATDLLTRNGPPTTIRGSLSLPPDTGSRMPAIVIAHGSGGITARREGAWSERLNAMGVAAFVVDSFGPRGIRTTTTDQAQLSTLANVADAFSALRLLATHPRIDPARIGVMGFSKGGQVALYTSLEPLRRAVIDGDLRFAAHIALYPSCSLPYIAKQVTGAPILILAGGADDYTPAAHCVRYVDYFRNLGADARFVVLDGAHHGFDVLRPAAYLSSAQTARNCRMDIELEPVGGRLWDSGAWVPPDQIGRRIRDCSARGAIVGGNEAALNRSIEEIRQLVGRALLK